MIEKLRKLSPLNFENLIFDLLQEIGLKNTVWRTPGRDGGRDIQGEWFFSDLSGYNMHQVWYVECKKYSSSVSWPIVWEKISFAQSNSADVLLFTVTSSLSPQAVDEVNKWNAQKNRPTIRFWNGVDIVNKLKTTPLTSIKYGLIKNPKTEIGGALLPAIKILLKYSIAAQSADIFERSALSVQRKNNVVYSLSELIYSRLEDLSNNNYFLSSPFRADKDGYDWMNGAIHIENSNADRYVIRAIACYLIDYMKKDSISIYEKEGYLVFDLTCDLPQYIYNDLYHISQLSNCEIKISESNLFYKERK
ncbi:restriction endonuclease [Aeromonas enteropelogenes]|uniref:restriction endonuclease n=1 Tax=Aeromonas enteropelogenes TaxID=29489 RepID=UPI003135F923